MGCYGRFVLPRLIHLAMRQGELVPHRAAAVGPAAGRVLEVGVGSGLNLPLYGPAAGIVLGLDPSAPLLGMAVRRAGEAGAPVALIGGTAEAIPLPDASVDTVVMTWTLCSIPEPERALAEMRRVLKPEGMLRFVEHGLAPEPGVAAWQRRLTPIWRRIGGGCRLDRPMDRLITAAGFRLDELRSGYINRLRPLSFLYEGSGRPR